MAQNIHNDSTLLIKLEKKLDGVSKRISEIDDFLEATSVSLKSLVTADIYDPWLVDWGNYSVDNVKKLETFIKTNWVNVDKLNGIVEELKNIGDFLKKLSGNKQVSQMKYTTLVKKLYSKLIVVKNKAILILRKASQTVHDKAKELMKEDNTDFVRVADKCLEKANTLLRENEIIKGNYLRGESKYNIIKTHDGKLKLIYALYFPKLTVEKEEDHFCYVVFYTILKKERDMIDDIPTEAFKATRPRVYVCYNDFDYIKEAGKKVKSFKNEKEALNLIKNLLFEVSNLSPFGSVVYTVDENIIKSNGFSYIDWQPKNKTLEIGLTSNELGKYDMPSAYTTFKFIHKPKEGIVCNLVLEDEDANSPKIPIDVKEAIKESPDAFDDYSKDFKVSEMELTDDEAGDKKHTPKTAIEKLKSVLRKGMCPSCHTPITRDEIVKKTKTQFQEVKKYEDNIFNIYSVVLKATDAPSEVVSFMGADIKLINDNKYIVFTFKIGSL